MSAYVLIVEDEDAFVRTIQRVLLDISSTTKVKVARSRDAAFALLDSSFFDLVILDLKIPTADGLLDTDPQHGFAVFGRAQAVAIGTPIFVLTGSPAENFIPELLRGARQVDVWGEGRNIGTVDFLPKYRFDEFPEKLRPSITAISALDDVELDRNGVELSIQDARLVRIFSRRYGGTRVVASILGGGLSGVKVLRLRVTNSQGVIIYDAVAKFGSLSAVTDEGGRFDSLVARLEAKATPRKLITLEAGAGAMAGIFYSLAAGFEETAFQAACGESGYAIASVASVESATRRWREGVNETRRTVREVRQRLLEPPRLPRRLHDLRTWSQDEEVEVFTRGARACRADGAGAPQRARVAVGLHRVHCGQDRLHGADAGQLGQAA